MNQKSHSVLGEGLLTGLVGGVIVAVWYLAYDFGRGQVGYTPNLLGQVFVGRDTMPAVHTIVPRQWPSTRCCTSCCSSCWESDWSP